MSQIEFKFRLFLLVLSGLLYVFTFLCMAKRNSQESTPLKHPVLKIIGILFAILGVIYVIGSIIFITQANYSVIDNTISYRDQSSITTGIFGSFIFFGLSTYCFLFKSSNSKWWIKVRKVIFGIILTFLFASAANFDYHDSFSIVTLCLFFIICCITITIVIEETPIIPNPKKDESQEVVQENKQIAQNRDYNSSQTIDENHSETEAISDTKDESETVFCRFCGGTINSTEIYCKHCGKKL